MNLPALEAELSQLPLYIYSFLTPQELEFSPRIRHICQTECPMYGKTWACPPAVGEVAQCQDLCQGYNRCLLIGTVAECDDIADIAATLATRPAHEAITNQVGKLLRSQGLTPYILSTEACTYCDRCAYLDGQPCRYPDRMHPCIESHGINLIPTLEALGVPFQYGENIITWYSLLFFSQET